MRKKVFLLLFLLVCYSFELYSATDFQQLLMKKGWNLSGTYLNNVSMTNFSDSNINSIWKWSDGNWQVWSPNQTILDAISAYGVKIIKGFISGEGFWLNAKSQVTLNLQGVKEENTSLKFTEGWNLLSTKNKNTLYVEKLNGYKDIITIWKWSGESWKVWSPHNKIMSTILNYGLKIVKSINPGEGFWLNAGDNGEINGNIETPPSPGLVYVLTGKLNTVPLPNADVYINGQYIGKTDEKGAFNFSGYSDGALVTVIKKGYAKVFGKIKNGKVLLITQKDYSQKVTLKSTNNLNKVADLAIKSFDDSVILGIKKYKSKKDITVSVIPFMSSSAVPALNDINVNGEIISAKQLSPIGGAFINVEDSNGKLITGEELDNLTVNFKVRQTKFLGDLELILNGLTKIPTKNFQDFAEDAYKKLQESILNGVVSLYYLKYINGKWVYAGKAEIKEVTQKTKKGNGTVSYKKYVIEGPIGDYDTKWAPFAFVLKLNYLTGDATICVKEGGYKMFDGTIVTTNQSDNETPFEWVGKPIPNASTIGDDSIVSPPGFTGEDGCITVSYKVPFVSPTFTISFKKDGYHDAKIDCTITTDGVSCKDGIMYRIPDTASIKGYVTNKFTGESIEKALVTLVNPEVLTADKIKSGIYENGNAYIKVGYNPTVEYTWTVKKDNKTIILKENCVGNPNCAEVTKDEIFDKIIKPYDDNDPSNNPMENPTGTWELFVKAVHKFTNTDKILVESAFGSFNIDILNGKLSEFASGNLSEAIREQIVYDNGTQATLPNGLKTAAVYGGMSLGYLYEYGAQTDEFEWRTDLVANSGDLFGDCIEGITIDDPIANLVGLCYQHVTPNVLIYKKSLYPMGLNIKFLNENFPYLLKPDTANNNKPFFKSGFTIRTIFKGTIDLSDLGQDNITQYLSSYMNMDEDAIPSLSAILDIPQIKLVGESVTAYIRQVFTDETGFYQINLIPPQLNGKLQIFAKAEGYKFDANTDIKLVTDLKAGYVSEYDLTLEPAGELPPTPTVWEGWEFKSTCNIPNVKWQVVDQPEEIYIKNVDWIKAMGYEEDEKVGLLPDKDNETEGYLWFGNIENGMITDKNNFDMLEVNESSDVVCGMAISPVFDLSNYAFPVLNFDSWFEVESVDVAKEQYDQLNIGFMIVADNDEPVTVYSSNGDKLQLTPNTFYSITLLNPDNEPDIQSGFVPYSNQGVNTVPVWEKFSFPVDMLSGYKVKFIFYFNSEDEKYNGFRGWGIDSVKVADDVEKVFSFPPQPPKLMSTDNATEKLERRIR